MNLTNDGILPTSLFEVKVQEEPLLCFDVSSDSKIYTGSCDNTANVMDLKNPGHFTCVGEVNIVFKLKF